MNIRTRVSTDKVWHHVKNIQAEQQMCERKPGTKRRQCYLPHKLHISIAPESFSSVFQKIDKILLEATRKLIIPSYKYLNFAEHEKRHPLSERTPQLPFTIYLNLTFTTQNAGDVVRLCQQIEELLSNIPSGNSAHFTVADIILSKHFTFRQTALGKREHLDAYDIKASELREAGLKSEYYTFLQKALEEKPSQTTTYANLFSKPKQADENMVVGMTSLAPTVKV